MKTVIFEAGDVRDIQIGIGEPDRASGTRTDWHCLGPFINSRAGVVPSQTYIGAGEKL